MVAENEGIVFQERNRITNFVEKLPVLLYGLKEKGA